MPHPPDSYKGMDGLALANLLNSIVRSTQPVRGLRRQQGLGKYRDEFKATAPRQGVVLIRVHS